MAPAEEQLELTAALPRASRADEDDDIAEDAPQGPASLTVSQLTQQVKGLLEKQIGLVWVRGEISNFKPSPSGHVYFSLKDEGASLSCAMFRGASSKMRFAVKDGMEVLVRGRISVYAPRGNYQLIAESMEPLGAGALQLAFEQLKKKLAAEGLFDAAHKKPIPPFPRRVVLITSPTGAALQDMLNVLGRRNAGISLLIAPTLVQGNEACAQLAAALGVVNKFDLADVIIIGRGGGSMEDLWCFNDEVVVRAVAASRIPVISAVGHEVDFTLCDFAADLRAPTPSAAAELVSKNRVELLDSLRQQAGRLRMAAINRTGALRQRVMAFEARLVSPAEKVARVGRRLEELELRLTHGLQNRLPPLRQDIDEAQAKITRLVERQLSDRKRELERGAASLEALSPLKVLGRGYTLVKDSATGHYVKSRHDAEAGHRVKLIFHDGESQAEIL